jgi:IS605 OrfB family transposase
MDRKEKGSANREKARHRVAVLHRKVRETRADHHHKLALRLVRENQAVALEGLPVAGLARTRNGKSVRDAGWGMLIQFIHEKAAQHGREVPVISQWEPTTKVCSCCGAKGGPTTMRVRVWTCPSCGAVLDRDYNAAVNVLLAAGLAESLNACGGDVRLRLAGADPGEAGTRRTDRAPVARRRRNPRRAGRMSKPQGAEPASGEDAKSGLSMCADPGVDANHQRSSRGGRQIGAEYIFRPGERPEQLVLPGL